MLRCFPRADENHRNVYAVALLENRIARNVHFAKDCASLAQNRRHRILGFLAEVATRPCIQRHFARACRREPRILRMLRHGFGCEYFWNGPEYGWNARARYSSAICRKCPKSCEAHSFSICPKVIEPSSECVAARSAESGGMLRNSTAVARRALINTAKFSSACPRV